jgi:thiol peroxidase
MRQVRIFLLGHNKKFVNFEEKVMAKITLKGNTVNTSGNLPLKGMQAPEFTLVKSDFGKLSLSELLGKKVLLNIFPSLETSVCSTSIRKFNQLAARMPDTVVLAISKDLPLAHGRFCSTEGIDNVVPLSGFNDSEFGKNYGLEMVDGLWKGLYSRCVIIIDEKGLVKYTQQVPEIATEPDYDAALAAF